MRRKFYLVGNHRAREDEEEKSDEVESYRDSWEEEMSCNYVEKKGSSKWMILLTVYYLPLTNYSTLFYILWICEHEFNFIGIIITTL